MNEATVLTQLFSILDVSGYSAAPLTPDRLKKDRAAAEVSATAASALLRRFQLGLDVPSDELTAEGIDATLQALLKTLEQRWGSFVVSRAAPLASGEPSPFVLHSRWPPLADASSRYAHFGAESYRLACFMADRAPRWSHARQVLDLGCSSGGLGFFLAASMPGAHIQGLDPCTNALDMGRAAAEAQGLASRMEFLVGELLDPRGGKIPREPPDLVVFNPPMVMAEPGFNAPHRDGGRLGMELPLRFIDFAIRNLAPGGCLYCLATNPLVGGRGLFFDELKAMSVKITDQQLLDPVFNQSVARKRGHDAAGVERIELWALELKPRQ